MKGAVGSLRRADRKDDLLYHLNLFSYGDCTLESRMWENHLYGSEGGAGHDRPYPYLRRFGRGSFS